MGENNNNSGLATEKQLKYIGFLRGKTGSEKFKEIVKKIGLKEDVVLKELTSEEASILIDELQKLVPQENAKKSSFKDRMEDYITFEELLKEVHKKFKKVSIETNVQTGEEGDGEALKKLLDKGFVVRAEVKTEKGTYTAYGDATADNTTNMVQNALLRMAETRAVARACRFATGIGKIAKEEVEG